MAFPIRIHYDNANRFAFPMLHAWYDGSPVAHDIAPAGSDAFGPYFDLDAVRNFVRFKFWDSATHHWEPDTLNRAAWPIPTSAGPDKAWCKADKPFVYHTQPRTPSTVPAVQMVQSHQFVPQLYIPGTGGLSGLGALPLAGGGVLFGLYHPNAARVYVAGDFNQWQAPGKRTSNPALFIEMDLHRGWYGEANTWLKVVPNAAPNHEYKFYVEGGVPTRQDGRAQGWILDPYARALGKSFQDNNACIVDPSGFVWHDAAWRTPDPADLIIYELSVYGFTEGDTGISQSNRGRFAGITERIRAGYFRDLGVTALSLMPLAEFSSMQSPDTLGYNPSLYMTVERDFGSPDDLRALVDEAHAAGLTVLLDQVFNHTDNSFNPLWKLILEHPHEEYNLEEGGLYFSGKTRWGNRVATEKSDVQNMLIDACKMWIREYHVDGFRYDATHSGWTDHGFLHRLAEELRGFKPDVLLVAENLPNESDLNRRGFDGYAQWCDPFHDKVKALLREGQFEGQYNTPDGLGDTFYFNKGTYAAHTNNAVNYCESHDEHSIPHEVHYTPWLDNYPAKERKARLGLFASVVALGQPMLYMGQEFNTERPRNFVTVLWPGDPGAHGYYQWVSRLVRLRRRYPALRLRGYNPADDGQFAWILGPWMDPAHGGGRRIVGWRATPTAFAHDTLVVLLNFEPSDQTVDLELGPSGTWLKLADIDFVNDIPPEGTNSPNHPTALRTHDGRFAGFTLPSSSAYIYKWESP